MTRLGHDFGTTAMGVGQVAAARACTCDPEMRSHGIDTIDCPAHGLAAFFLALAKDRTGR